MLPYAYYLLKVIICSSILFGYYWLMLRNKIFHQYNRFYLLAAVILSMGIPLIQFNIWHHLNGTAPQAIQLLQVVNGSNEYLDKIIISTHPSNFSTELVLSFFYSAITLMLLIFFLQSIIKIRILFKNNRHSYFENVFFVNTTAKGTPFSFLRYIFWNDYIDPESTTGKQIFKHELAHVHQKHSYDKLFLNATLILFWCNPFFWLVRKELNMIHEFMADKIAVEDSNTEAFAAMILQATYPQHRFLLTNPFFYSPIKRRLLMLKKNKNPQAGYIGRILVLPLAVLVFAAFTFKARPFNSNSFPIYNGKKITVVIDAGHGGRDKGAVNLDGTIAEKDLNLAIIQKIKALNKNPQINYVFTRETDITQSVKEKADFTKARNADLFISIHLSATSVEEANSKTGMSVYVSRDNFANSNSSKLFASAVIQEFTDAYELSVASLPFQGETGIWVLQESTCPAVIIEPGYITNYKDLAYLRTTKAQEIIAVKILAAVENYAFAKEKKEAVVEAIPLLPIQNITAKKTDTVPTITLKNYEQALILLDGKTISNETLKKVKPESIESVRVIKDKAALIQYGEKGKNGVVIIETKEKNIIFKDLTITVQEDSTTTKAVVSGNIKIHNNASAEKQPMYVVDGKIITNEFNLNSINPNDIESVNVLKGKTALDKYGEPGINGVVEITTKGKKAIKVASLMKTPDNNTDTAFVIAH